MKKKIFGIFTAVVLISAISTSAFASSSKEVATGCKVSTPNPNQCAI